MTDSEPDPCPSALRSVHTTNLPSILSELGISLLVSTYQAGKLVVVRSAGEVLNTHFRDFDKPMGIAASTLRVALGTAREVQEYYNVPALTGKLIGPGPYDACYVPRNRHTTGDIDIHEMAWADDGALWVVNTRFSCLCTLDREHSFVPRWRPPFISGLAPEDRCHLNGLAMVDGCPRYVTALGAGDAARGWRDNKAAGGVLIDIDCNRLLAQGLSMPHSPRWHAGRLWVLESGRGALATVDLHSGQLLPIAELPGFPRGLDLIGNLAFVGLSQVRESAMFSGIPITETLDERICGVWVVNISNGETVAFLRFEEAVQEIFAVQAIGCRYLEILEQNDPLIASSYTLPQAALAEVPESHRSSPASPSDIEPD